MSRNRERIIVLIVIVVISAFAFSTIQLAKEPEKPIVPPQNVTLFAFHAITTREIAENIKLLSHEALEGRGTGSADFDFVGEFLARELREYGFKPLIGENFFQEFHLKVERVKYKGKWYEVGVLSGPGKDTLTSRNVLGILEGTDLKREVVVISAHYDHLGEKNGTIYYGADDNGSGVGAVLELAEAFGELEKQGIRPRRSILIAFWGAEELGLSGSRYFVTHCPIPFGNIVAVINLDMVGRNDPNKLYVIGSENPLEFSKKSPELYQIIIEANQETGFNFIYDDQGERYFERVDAFSFFWRSGKKLAVVTFTDGEHSDYHQPTDIFEKIDNEKARKVSYLTFLVAWKIANIEGRPSYHN